MELTDPENSFDAPKSTSLKKQAVDRTSEASTNSALAKLTQCALLSNTMTNTRDQRHYRMLPQHPCESSLATDSPTYGIFLQQPLAIIESKAYDSIILQLLHPSRSFRTCTFLVAMHFIDLSQYSVTLLLSGMETFRVVIMD